MSLHTPNEMGKVSTPCVNCGLEIHFNKNSRRWSSNEWNSISCKEAK